MKLLHVLASVDPLGGGPTEGVRQRGLRLRDWGHTVEVVTVDDPQAAHVKDFPFEVHAMGPPRGSYRYSDRLVPWLARHAGSYDAIVVNGIWQYHSYAAWRALQTRRIPYFVFTHGMLDPWFKHNYPLKHVKKWLYWPWADYRVLRDARAVLFTSEEERLLARQSFWLYHAHEEVVAYGTRSPPADSAALREAFLSINPRLRGRRSILFLSRIHEKKGCDHLIQAFAAVAAEHADLDLVMAGPDQSGWVSRLRQQAAALGVAERIVWPGMLRDAAKWGAFYCAEAFALPSHQENFGIAVAEALACGLPALISDKVNIWREVKSSGAGLVGPDTAAGATHVLAEWLAMPAAARQTMSEQARRLFTERFTVDAMASSLLQVVSRDRSVAAASA